jgi:Holliday junction DNA helicase RuvA
MISFLKGKIFKSSLGNPSFVEIETNGGVGYKVMVSKKFDFKKKGEEIFLFTSLQVREDSQTLYGFEKEEEKDMFENLLTVSGIGPKIAMSILSEYSCKEVKDIVLNSDVSALKKVSGLGKKGSQKIILELSGKVDFSKSEESKSGMMLDIESALKNLGYSGSLLKETVKKAEVIYSKDKKISIEELLKSVLKS